MRRTSAIRHPRRPSGLRSGGAAAVAAVLLALAGLPACASAQTLMTQEEALDLAFPAPTRVERATAYLSDAQLAEARERAGDDVSIEQGVVTYYVGYRDGRPVGVAYFDVHRVRTKAEVVMVVVTPDARIQRIDVVKFTEPPEYRAPDGWIEQLEGRALDDELALTGSIRNLTGATLTARALTRAARRVLALHAVIESQGSS
jgi:electron transport complex protein RnfG